MNIQNLARLTRQSNVNMPGCGAVKTLTNRTEKKTRDDRGLGQTDRKVYCLDTGLLVEEISLKEEYNFSTLKRYSFPGLLGWLTKRKEREVSFGIV